MGFQVSDAPPKVETSSTGISQWKPKFNILETERKPDGNSTGVSP